MGILDFLKKKEVEQEKVSVVVDKSAKPKTDLEHLTKEGGLPLGWHTYTKEFTDKIKNEYSYFLNRWVDSRSRSSQEQYSALKSFVIYLEDVEKLCKSKGECYEFWFYEILISKDYLKKRKKELDALEPFFKER